MKHFFIALGTALLLASTCLTPVLAEEITEDSEEFAEEAAYIAPAYYPNEIHLQEDGTQVLVVKEYCVPSDTLVEDLLETAITRMGQNYQLWGVSQIQETSTLDEITLRKTIEVALESNIPEEATALLQQTITYEDNDYSGTLHLEGVTCETEMQEDGTYKCSAIYTGNVSKEIPGNLLCTLIYAPVPEEAEEIAAPMESSNPMPFAVAGAFGTFLLGCAAGALVKRPEKKQNTPTEERGRPKVYVPSEDVVLGAGKRTDEEE